MSITADGMMAVPGVLAQAEMGQGPVHVVGAGEDGGGGGGGSGGSVGGGGGGGGGPAVGDGATTGQPGAPGGGTGGVGGANTTQTGFPPLLTWMFLILIGVMLFSMMSGRKDKRKRQDMLSSLGKQDKIQTVGGIIATVADVKGDEVLIRVEEGSNIRIRISRSAVQQVLRRGKQKESSSDVLSEPETVSK